MLLLIEFEFFPDNILPIKHNVKYNTRKRHMETAEAADCLQYVLCSPKVLFCWVYNTFCVCT